MKVSRTLILIAVIISAVPALAGAVSLVGALDIRTLAEVERSLKQRRRHLRGVLDLCNLSGLDTAGALFLCELRDKGVKLTGIRAEHKALLDLVCGLELKPLAKVRSVP